MSMILFILVGIGCLFGGAEFLIRGGASVALRMGLPVLVIALTIMGFGTGTPELVVSIQASLAGKGDIALGNVIGSNIANTGLVLGIAALCRPIPIKQQIIKRDGPIMVFVTFVLCFLIAFNHEITRLRGIVLMLGLMAYTIWSIYIGRKEKALEEEVIEERHLHKYKNAWIEWGLILFGFMMLFLGGRFFLEGAIALAKMFDISDAVLGLTVIALGTSLPELATSVVAVMRKHEDIALGNVIGSNIFNILAIVGVASFLNPIQIVDISWIDYSYLTILTVALWWIIRSRPAVTRWEGSLMLLSYFTYMGYLLFTIR